MKKLLKWAAMSTVALGVLLGLSACAGESIDGAWISPTSSEEMYAEFVKSDTGEMFPYSKHSITEIVTKGEVTLTSTEDNAVMDVVFFVDAEAFFTALKDEQDAALRDEFAKQGLNYEELTDEEKAEIAQQLPSEEEIREMVTTSLEEMAKGLEGTYDAEKGLIVGTVFTADVDRVAKVFDITSVGGVLGKDIVKKDESYQYTYKDSKLTLEGETDKDDVVFEKQAD